MTNTNFCYTITFGDRAENSIGMEIIGGSVKNGYSDDDIGDLYNKLTELGLQCHYYDLKICLKNKIPKKDYDAVPETSILIIKGLADNILNEHGKTKKDLLKEIRKLKCDDKFWSYGSVKNKIARHNLCFSDFSQKPDYENKKGTVINFSDVPLLNTVRNALPNYFGKKSKKLQGELNYYYDIEKCGIGYHGDTERKIVIALRLGSTIPLTFRWFKNGNQVIDDTIYLDNIESGDFCIMSDFAVGNKWKCKNIYTIRHAAGCSKYVQC